MSYSDEDLEQLEEQYVGLEGRCNDVISRYLEREFTHERANEFVRHGLCRRLRLMTRCIAKVFEILPPQSCEVPGADVLHDVTVQLHAFSFNTFGCLDNLAHAWVLEKGVKKKNGDPLPLQRVGFGSGCTEVRDSLPDRFVEYLLEIRDWYENLENFRHALAHRIPMYIPPGYLDEEQAAKYSSIQGQINDAVGRKDFAIADRLEDKQAALLSFHPIATHSFGENAKIVYFHAQMLSDIGTVQEIASRLLPEFDGWVIMEDAAGAGVCGAPGHRTPDPRGGLRKTGSASKG